jgi:hypothetical protein
LIDHRSGIDEITDIFEKRFVEILFLHISNAVIAHDATQIAAPRHSHMEDFRAKRRRPLLFQKRVSSSHSVLAQLTSSGCAPRPVSKPGTQHGCDRFLAVAGDAGDLRNGAAGL